MTRESKEVCSTWRPIGVWHQSMARESIRRRPLSYSSRSTLMTHSNRSKQRCFKSNTSKQSSEKASSWHVTVLPSLRFASKNVIFSPEMRILPGEPLQKCVFYPPECDFYRWTPLQMQLGGFCCENLATVACYMQKCLKAYERSLLQNGTWKLLKQ